MSGNQTVTQQGARCWSRYKKTERANPGQAKAGRGADKKTGNLQADGASAPRGPASKGNGTMADTFRVKLVKSGIGRPQKHKDTLRGLGLTKMNKTVTLNDTPAIRGMVQKVIHLVEVLPD